MIVLGIKVEYIYLNPSEDLPQAWKDQFMQDKPGFIFIETFIFTHNLHMGTWGLGFFPQAVRSNLL